MESTPPPCFQQAPSVPLWPSEDTKVFSGHDTFEFKKKFVWTADRTLAPSAWLAQRHPSGFLVTPFCLRVCSCTHARPEASSSAGRHRHQARQ